MNHIRPIDWESGTDAGIAGYRGQILYAGESCYVIATKVPPGVEGPARHTHASDQIYAVLEGTTTVELGAEERAVGPLGSVFIPAGVPHHNRNDGDVDEVHIEVIAPGGFLQPIATPTDSTDAKGLPYRTTEPAATNGNGGGFATTYLVNRESGSLHASVYLAELAPGASGPPLHVHDFDQLYFVIEGTLEVQIGLAEHVVGANTLVVLPAGVPHKQRNASDTAVERHLTILVPEPELPHSPEHPWDVAVALQPTGVHI
jgi:mannose-6-phosphate isomerase-like protein (cupin superfamily)